MSEEKSHDKILSAYYQGEKGRGMLLRASLAEQASLRATKRGGYRNGYRNGQLDRAARKSK
jgi:hypothetical protein